MSAGSPVRARRRLGPLLGIAALVLVALVAGLIAYRGPDPSAVPSAQAVYDRTESPFCTGLTLAACPSSQAVELRARIATMVSQRQTNRQIDAYLTSNYPSRILGTHSPVAWLIPALAVLIGLAVIAGVMLRRPNPSVEPPLPAIAPADHARLAADLRRFAEGVSE